MQIYSCKVRLNGSLLNEVRLNATAAEVMILKIIHGDDAVIDLKIHPNPEPLRAPDGSEIKRTDEVERERLAMQYNGALAKIEDIKSLNGLFSRYGPLPAKLPEHDDLSKLELPKPEKKTYKKPKKEPAPETETADEGLGELV